MNLGSRSLNNPIITVLNEDRLVLQESTKTRNLLDQLLSIVFPAGFFYMFFIKRSSSDIILKFGAILFIGVFIIGYFNRLFINSIVVDRPIRKVQFIRAPKMRIFGKTKEVDFSDITSIELEYYDGVESGGRFWSTKIKTISSGDLQAITGEYEPLPRIIAEKISELTGKPIV